MNKTINELVALTELANDDELIVFDVSEGTSKKIKKSDFVTNSIESGNQKPPTSEAVADALNRRPINEDASSWFVNNNYLELGYAWHTAEGRIHTLDFNGIIKQGIYELRNEKIFNIPSDYKSVTSLVEFSVFITDSVTQCGRGYMDSSGVKVWCPYNANTIQGFYFGHITWIV